MNAKIEWKFQNSASFSQREKTLLTVTFLSRWIDEGNPSIYSGDDLKPDSEQLQGGKPNS